MGNKNIKLGFVSTYPPRACGIATFTQDLVHEMEKLPCIEKPVIIAMCSKKLSYSPRVKLEIEQKSRTSYRKAAYRVN
jgi:polysaccharide biosynthesis protein PslF